MKPRFIILRDRSRYANIRLYDRTTGELNEKVSPTDGGFEIVGGQVIAFYSAEGRIWLQIGPTTVLIDDGVTSEHVRYNVTSRLTVRRGDSVVFEYEYPTPHPDPPLERDPTPMVELAHFDFLLSIHNIISKRERQQVMLETHEELARLVRR